MSMRFIYWAIMLVWLVFGLYVNWSSGYAMGGAVLLFILLVLLGWKVYGKPISE